MPLDAELAAVVRRKAQPVASLLAEIDKLRAELAQAREDYRLCNRRVIEVLGEKIALQIELERLRLLLAAAEHRKHNPDKQAKEDEA